MAKIRLDLSQFKASGIYTIEFDASQSIILNTQTTRLVVGFSKKGPINAPVYCPDVKTARRIYGDIDKDLENKGSFFHRSLFTCLETGPCFGLALLKLNDDTSSANADYDLYKSFSMSTTEANGSTASVLYSSFFNKERFYFPDTSYFLANVNSATSPNIGKLLNFVNLGQTPFSIFISKTGDLTGFNVTAREWFGSGNVPDFVREFDYISDYFVNIDVISGDWTNYATLSADPDFSQYFNTSGLIKSKATAFMNSSFVTRLGSFQGCLIPDLVDNNGVNYSIDTIVNAGVATTGLFCALDRTALDDYDPTAINDAGRVDMIGHTLINPPAGYNGTVNFLSYNFTSTEYKDYPQGSTHSWLNNQLFLDFGTGATGNLPGGLGSTGASYSAAANGWDSNLPSKVAYFESYYGSGNEGKFDNLLVIRREALNDTQYNFLSSLNTGYSIALEGPTGATQYATISSYNEVTVGSDVRLKLGISHPDKQFEGTTVGKNAAVLSVGATYMVVGGTAAANDINVGDWIFAENTGVRYYFRTVQTVDNGTDSELYVDTTNAEFGGATNIANITSFYDVYWESTLGVAGSLFDIVDTALPIKRMRVVKEPDIFNYVSPGGSAQNYYIGYKYSGAFEDVSTGVIADGDKIYVNGVYPQPLYLSASFTQDGDALPIVNMKAYRDPELTIGYTGSWTFNDIVGSTGASAGDLRIYSLVGDYASTIGATGFNTTYTTCYISAADESKVQVGQFLVADPLNTGNIADYILTRVISKKKISSGTYNGFYEIKVNQRLANINAFTDITRYRAVQDVATNYQLTYLPGFTIKSTHLPNGSNSRLAEILSLLDPGVSNLSEGLSSRHIIAFRYIIDTFNGGLNTQSAPKNLITKLAMRRQKCMAIMNAPSIQQFINSTDPRFTEAPTQTDPKPLLNTRYISEGGNLSLGPSFTYSLPDEENGAKFAGFFAPFLVIRENNKNFTIPPAADVSNNFIRKFINGQPYSIVAGPRRGVLSNPKLVGLEYDFTDNDRGFLEPFGWNPIVFRRGIGFMIFGNQSAFQKTPSAFNNLHVRDLLITVEETIEDILANFLFEFNDASTRLQIKSIVDAFLDNVRSAGGIYDYKTIMDETNNTPDIIDQNFAIIDVGIEPARGAQKFINRITVLKTGGIASGGFSVA
jgi:hypothetical protein